MNAWEGSRFHSTQPTALPVSFSDLREQRTTRVRLIVGRVHPLPPRNVAEENAPKHIFVDTLETTDLGYIFLNSVLFELNKNRPTKLRGPYPFVVASTRMFEDVGDHDLGEGEIEVIRQLKSKLYFDLDDEYLGIFTVEQVSAAIRADLKSIRKQGLGSAAGAPLKRAARIIHETSSKFATHGLRVVLMAV